MRQGIALLLVVGVLALLAVLATTFAALAQLERRAALTRLQATQAELLARSGLEDALARLSAGQAPDYGGEDWDDSGALDGPEPAAEVYRPGALDVDACPARHALRPSFFQRDALGRPVLQGMDGRARGMSGRLASGRYGLRVLEPGIHVNGGDLSSPGEHPGTYDATLKRILGNLAEALGLPRPDGEDLVTSRPQGGWTSLVQVPESMRPYLALSAWVDRKVIRPNARPSLGGAGLKAWAEYRTGQSDDPGFSGGRAPTIPVFEPRAPVSLAWARTRPAALEALLRDLSGLWVDESWASNEQMNWPGPDNLVGKVQTATLGLQEARNVAAALGGYGGNLDTWQDFQAFCDTLTSDVSTGLTGKSAPEVQAKRDLVKANFNPNSDLNKFGPNPTLWKLVDKSDLLAYSAEFCLEPVHGHWVASSGRVLGTSGRLLAERTLSLRVAPLVLRLTTQREFACADLGDPAVPVDEGPARLPGQWPYLSFSLGLDKGWGHALPGLFNRGLALQTYPEPCVDAGGGLSLRAADYDGNLQLATIETALGEDYGVMATTERQMMLARFDTRLDLDVAASGNVQHLPDARQVTVGGLSELSNSLLDPNRPNTLHPDGCFSERNRAPGYYDKGNANGLQGVISFWVKQNHDVYAISQQYNLSKAFTNLARGHAYVKWVNYSPDDPGTPDWTEPQHFWIVNANVMAESYSLTWPWDGFPPTTFMAFFEHSHQDSDIQSEFMFNTLGTPIVPHGWHLVSFFFDFQSPTGGFDAGEMVADGGGAVPTMVGDRDYFYAPIGAYAPFIAAMSASDLTIDACETYGGPLKPHRIFLGTRAPANGPWVDGADPAWLGGGADATIDEFAIYDFGHVPLSANALAASRHAQGRYYKGSAYTSLVSPPVPDLAGMYFSAPIWLPPGSAIRRLSWTWYRPSALPDDYAEIALADYFGTGYLWGEAESRSVGGKGWTPDRQDWVVDRAATLPFRIQAVFRRQTPLGLNTPLLDSPVLDDITLLYEPPGGPRLLGFSDRDS